LRLTSTDPNVATEIHLNYLEESEELRRMVEGMRLAWRVLHNEHLGPYVNKIFGLTQEIVESERRTPDPFAATSAPRLCANDRSVRARPLRMLGIRISRHLSTSTRRGFLLAR
jgi:hypothetical protein